MFITKLAKLMTMVVVFMAITTHTEVRAAEEKKVPKVDVLTVFKSPTCGCCKGWVKHINDSGLSTIIENRTDLSEIKNLHKIHPKLQSCHTGVTEDGYVFEGHIPAKFIKKFLADRPKGYKGLAVPGMPAGTPGMDYGSNFTPYKIYALKLDGTVEIYAEVNSAKEQL